MKSRKLLFLAVVAVAVAFGVGGYVLGQQLESPEDARAEVAPPEASLIAVPVESVALSNDVVVRGDAGFEGAIDLSLDATLGDGTTRVVTGRVPAIDSLINEGDVAIEVSGRPVFMLAGDLPAFRSFKPGLEGDDVLQLETALSRLGFLSVEPDNLYGEATEEAVAAMYENQGYEARSADESEEGRLEAAEKAVENARTALADANDDLSELLKPDTEAQRVRDQQERQRFLDSIEQAQEALDETKDDRTQSRQALDRLTQAEIDGIGVAEANAALVGAEESERRAVEAAEEALEGARESLADYDELQSAVERDGTDTSGARRRIADAEETLIDLQLELEDLEEEIGVRLPAAEIVFLPDLPRTVTAVDVELGDFVNGPVMRISGTEIRIVTGVSETNRPLLEVGQQVIVTSDELGIEVTAEITELADRKGTKGVADTRYYMLIQPTGEHQGSEMDGNNFRLQIPLDRTEGDVLAVPLAALSAGADGSSRVEVERADGSTDLVKVEVGLQDRSSSLVEIKPIGDNIAQAIGPAHWRRRVRLDHRAVGFG